MFKAITAKEAEKILKRQGNSNRINNVNIGFVGNFSFTENGEKIYYAYDTEEDAVYEYDSKRERDAAVLMKKGK